MPWWRWTVLAALVFFFAGCGSDDRERLDGELGERFNRAAIRVAGEPPKKILQLDSLTDFDWDSARIVPRASDTEPNRIEILRGGRVVRSIPDARVDLSCFDGFTFRQPKSYPRVAMRFYVLGHRYPDGSPYRLLIPARGGIKSRATRRCLRKAVVDFPTPWSGS